jgi:lia operon protein LiaF
MHPSFLHRLFWGIVLVAMGAVFLLNQTGATSYNIGDLFANFWPVFIILFGLQGLLIQRAGGFLWNVLVILIGVVFLGRNLDWFAWNLGDMFKLIGPVILILFGINMIAKGGRPNQRRRSADYASNRWSPVTPPPVPPQPPMTPSGPPPAPPLSEDPNASFTGIDHFSAPSPPAEDYRTERLEHREERRRHREERWQQRDERRRQRHEHHNQRHQNHHQQRNDHREWWSHGYDPNRQEHHRFIGDVHIGQDYWELRPMSISHFIGDTTLDLTNAQIPLGETRIYVSCFIGDVKVFLPNDLGVGIQVVSSSLIGDVKVLDHKRGGFFNQMSVETPSYSDTDKRVVLVASSFIGDVRVTKVG